MILLEDVIASTCLCDLKLQIIYCPTWAIYLICNFKPQKCVLAIDHYKMIVSLHKNVCKKIFQRLP